MAEAGTDLVAGKIPGQRIGPTTILTSDSSVANPTELAVASVTSPLIEAATYRVRFVGRLHTSTVDTVALYRIREDNLTGTVIQIGRFQINNNTGSTGVPLPVVEVEFQALTTADKTFAFTIERSAGGGLPTGTVFVAASSGGPAYFYVDYIRG